MRIDIEYQPKEYIDFAVNEINFLFEFAVRYDNAYDLVIDTTSEYASGTFKGTPCMKSAIGRLSDFVNVTEDVIDKEESLYTILVTQMGR